MPLIRPREEGEYACEGGFEKIKKSVSDSASVDFLTVALAAQGIMSTQARDEQQTALAAAKAAVDAARQNLDAAQANLRQAKAHELLTEVSARTVDQSRADEQNARALADQARVEESYAQVVAPIDGKVNVWAARQGEVVTAGRPSSPSWI